MRRSPCVAADRALRADRHLGAAVGRAVRAHQRRRLERVGWLGALDAPGGDWAAGDPRPRPGGSLEVLIEFAEALPRMVAELDRAESHVHIAGWFFSPDFALTREREPAILRDLLAALSAFTGDRSSRDAPAPLVRTLGAAGRAGRRRAGTGDRRLLETDQQRAAGAPRSRGAADTPARPAPASLEALGAPTRPTPGTPPRRLTRHGASARRMRLRDGGLLMYDRNCAPEAVRSCGRNLTDFARTSETLMPSSAVCADVRTSHRQASARRRSGNGD
jgi:hypothetical protein